EDTNSFPAAPSGNLIVLTEKGIQDFGAVEDAVSTIPTDMLLVGGYDWAIMLHSEEEIKLLERNME
ncbi:MAG: hypothetical protein VX278_22155, partial [Myxococcota bacterium]|nr:hypothetical protein [Myxococcota bacterium]